MAERSAREDGLLARAIEAVEAAVEALVRACPEECGGEACPPEPPEVKAAAEAWEAVVGRGTPEADDSNPEPYECDSMYRADIWARRLSRLLRARQAIRPAYDLVEAEASKWIIDPWPCRRGEVGAKPYSVIVTPRPDDQGRDRVVAVAQSWEAAVHVASLLPGDYYPRPVIARPRAPELPPEAEEWTRREAQEWLRTSGVGAPREGGR